MNKKIARGSLAGVAVIALAAGGGTFASWSDFGISPGQAAGAGIMRLDVSARDGAGAKVDAFRLAPGENKAQVFFLASANADNVPTGSLTVSIKNLKDVEDNGPGCTTISEAVAEAPERVDSSGLPTDPARSCGRVGELSGELKARIIYSDPVPNAASCSTRTIYTNNVNNVGASYTLAEQKHVGPTTLGTLGAGDGICVRVELSLPMSATDAVQGDDVSYDYRFDLEQSRS